MATKLCKSCSKPFNQYSSLQKFCPDCARKHHPKAMKKIGKVGKQTADYVGVWKAKQKPNHQGYYTCYIGADQTLYLTAEHPYSKTRHPDMRTNQKLEPVCDEHNALKGSLDIADFLEKYPQFKATVKEEYLLGDEVKHEKLKRD